MLPDCLKTVSSVMFFDATRPSWVVRPKMANGSATMMNPIFTDIAAK